MRSTYGLPMRLLRNAMEPSFQFCNGLAFRYQATVTIAQTSSPNLSPEVDVNKIPLGL